MCQGLVTGAHGGGGGQVRCRWLVALLIDKGAPKVALLIDKGASKVALLIDLGAWEV